MPQRRGTTIAEVIVATLLVSMVLLVSLDGAGSVALATRKRVDNVDAQILAQELMAEVMAMPYEDPDTTTPEFGLESDETSGSAERVNFDDLDDYDNWDESPPTDRYGVALSGYDSWKRSVSVEKLDITDFSNTLGDSETDQGLRRVVVQVEDADGDVTTLTSLRVASGATQQSTGADREVVTNITIDVTVGGETIHTGTNLRNHAID